MTKTEEWELLLSQSISNWHTKKHDNDYIQSLDAYTDITRMVIELECLRVAETYRKELRENV